MSLSVERVDVWAATIADQPGGLAKKLAPLSEAGADLEFVIARRATDEPGTGVVFVTPLRGDVQASAGAKAGFAVADNLHSLRIEGANKPGVSAQLTKKLANAKINLRGLSAAAIGERFIMYLAFDAADDAEKAKSVLQEVS